VTTFIPEHHGKVKVKTEKIKLDKKKKDSLKRRMRRVWNGNVSSRIHHSETIITASQRIDISREHLPKCEMQDGMWCREASYAIVSRPASLGLTQSSCCYSLAFREQGQQMSKLLKNIVIQHSCNNKIDAPET